MQADFRSYTHLERLGKKEVEGILNGTVSLFTKLDGANSSVWSDGENIYCGSRKRAISMTSDNAGFNYYMENDNDSEVAALRDYVKAHPNYIIYGEWLGQPGQKFIGTMKDYIEGGFFIFDVFDVDIGDYIPYDIYYPEIITFYHRVVSEIVRLENPTVDKVSEYIDKCNYNMPEGECGEGIVIKQYPSYRDVYGNIQVAKIVRDEYHEKKKDNHVNKQNKELIDHELQFVNTYCTNAFLAKCQNKVLIAHNEDEWDNKKGKLISYFLNLVYWDILNEDFAGFFRKHTGTVNLGRIKKLSQDKGRHFLGLI